MTNLISGLLLAFIVFFTIIAVDAKKSYRYGMEREMIKKLKTLEDFKNKKILFSEEVLGALLVIDKRLSFKEGEIKGIEVHSLHSCEAEFNGATEQEMFYSKEHGFYVNI